ncbi:MAG: hypothetical protein AAF554_02370 [Bacteroidota bacterium]
MKKPIACLLFLFLILSCGGGDDNPPVDTPEPKPIGMDNDPADGQDNETQIVSINLDGVPDLDLSSLTAVSPSGSAQINTSNELENISDDESPDLPIIFTNDSNVVMGYFPETLNNEEVQIEDVVFFFFKTFPALAVQRFDDATLNNMLVNAPKYQTMVDLVKDALNRNASVIDDSQFDELVREILEENTATNKKAEDVVAQFKFDYSRDGNIGIPNKAPLFSSMGVQVNQVGHNTPVFGPKILESQGLVLSPSSLFNFLLDEFVFAPEPMAENFILPQDGEYQIIFSNGSSDYADLDSEVQFQNYKYLMITTLSYAVPFGLERLSKGGECKTAMEDLLSVSRDFATGIIQSNTTPTATDLIEYTLEFSNNVRQLADCFQPNDIFSSYLLDFISFLNRRLSLAEDIAELTFFARDFFASDISGLETRYYEDGVSVGFLTSSQISGNMFEGRKDQIFTYESLVNEKEISYDVERGLTSQFIEKEEMKPASGLPFEYSKTGDVTVSTNNPIVTDNEGMLKFDMTLGEQDSEITLTPQFNSPRISDVPIIVSVIEANSGSLRSDALAIRSVFESNPQVTEIFLFNFAIQKTFNVDLNDPRWTSGNDMEVISIIEDYGGTVENGRVVEFGWQRIDVGSGYAVDLNEPITVIPNEIGNLTNLRELYIGRENSNFSLLPRTIANLEDLEILYLKENQSLRSLPSEIGNLINLRELYLQACTSLTSIPVETSNLSNLNYFTLCQTSNLLCLPQQVWDLVSRNNLDLSNIDLAFGDTDCSN